MKRHPHILNAAANLLGICFAIITILKVANLNAKSFADEFAWGAAGLLFVSIFASYIAIRNDDAKDWQTALAEWSFLGGVSCLALSALSTAFFL